MKWGIFVLGISSVLAQQSPHGPLSMECTSCHTTTSWTELLRPMKFDHGETGYVLKGEHQLAECKDCHTTLRFQGTPRVCYSCHRNDFMATALPNHLSAGFGTQCERCHDIGASSWQNSFDHTKTGFPLRGAHEGVACNTCHKTGTFRNVPLQCAECHRQDYAAANDPNHAAAGFSTDCEMCHRALTWQPAAFFPHENFFPISAGSTHRPGRWNSCRDCHTSGTNYQIFECINCHEHNKSSTDRHHGEVSGYVYQSSYCYRCHPRGEGGD